MSFFEGFSNYEDACPPGVKLPEIKIEDRFYKRLGADKGISNFDFLKKLCWEGVKKRGIDKFDNKNDYYNCRATRCCR